MGMYSSRGFIYAFTEICCYLDVSSAATHFRLVPAWNHFENVFIADSYVRKLYIGK